MLISDTQTRPSGNSPENTDVDVVVVGAGFAGLYQIFSARKMGLSVRGFERAGDVGGTWYWNRYPGARCDTPSMAYTVCYMPELDREWPFKEIYNTHDAIRLYIEEVATRADLRKHISFNTSIISARWDERNLRWVVSTDRGEEVRSRFLVMASGTLTAVPRTPDIPGLDLFQGRWFHTGRWPHEPVDFTGRRVAIVGTGSTGVQAVGAVAPLAAELTVFQRTPKFVAPAKNRALTDEEVSQMRAHYPVMRQHVRHTHGGIVFPAPRFEFRGLTEAEVDQQLDALWGSGMFLAVFAYFDEDSPWKNREVNDIISNYVRRKIKRLIPDPVTAEVLTPYGYPIGVNRPIIADGWYEAFNQPNVKLVDTRAEELVEVTETGIRTAAHEFEFDDIIFATGYDAMTGALTSIDIVGSHGRTIRDDWKEGPSTYLGLQAHNYPNLFMITAPGGPSVLANAVVTGEQNVDLVMGIITYMAENNLHRVEADADAQKAWTEHVGEVAQQSLFREAYKANTWYTGANVPGKKVTFMPYSGGVGTYEKICQEVVADSYRGFNFWSAEEHKSLSA